MPIGIPGSGKAALKNKKPKRKWTRRTPIAPTNGITNPESRLITADARAQVLVDIIGVIRAQTELMQAICEACGTAPHHATTVEVRPQPSTPVFIPTAPDAILHS